MSIVEKNTRCNEQYSISFNPIASSSIYNKMNIRNILKQDNTSMALSGYLLIDEKISYIPNYTSNIPVNSNDTFYADNNFWYDKKREISFSEVEIYYLSYINYKYNNMRYVFNRPYQLVIHKEEGNDVPFWYCIEDEYLNIDIMEESVSEAIKSFYSEIDFLWNHYANKEDKELAGMAVKLKKNIKELIREAIQL